MFIFRGLRCVYGYGGGDFCLPGSGGALLAAAPEVGGSFRTPAPHKVSPLRAGICIHTHIHSCTLYMCMYMYMFMLMFMFMFMFMYVYICMLYTHIYMLPPPVIYHFRPMKPNLTVAAVKS